MLYDNFMEYLLLGHIAGSFGLDGTLKVISTSTFQDARYQKGNKIYLGREKKELTVETYRTNGKFDFVKVLEIQDKETADKLKSESLFGIKDLSLLDKGFYYFSDLETCDVFDEDTNKIGKVIKVEEFPAQITLRVRNNKGKDFFVPFIKEFILDVDIESKKIVVRVIGGML